MSRARAAATARAVLAGAVLAVGAAACASTGGLAIHPDRVSACYRSLPVALDAVGEGHARLVGVHELRATELSPRVSRLLRELPSGNGPVCAVALRGPFAPGSVAGAAPGTAGRYAVVLVRASDHRLLGSVLMDRLPRAFGASTYH